MDHYRYRTNVAFDVVEVCLEQFKVIKETPKGYWLTFPWSAPFHGEYNWKKWVSKTSRKRFAYPTKEEAWDSYCIRRKRRVMHLQRQLDEATLALRATRETPVKLPRAWYEE